MSAELARLLDEIHTLEARVAAELGRTQHAVQYQVNQGRVVFEEQVRAKHRQMATALHRYVLHTSFLTLVTAPVIYLMIVPAVIMDVFVTVYQRICFPVYGIPRVSRAQFMVHDRHHLQYLNALEKLNCAYCSYFNGLAAYVVEIAGRTEQYWCPIKSARRRASEHSRYRYFFEYGDADAYAAHLAELRRAFEGSEQVNR